MERERGIEDGFAEALEDYADGAEFETFGPVEVREQMDFIFPLFLIACIGLTMFVIAIPVILLLKRQRFSTPAKIVLYPLIFVVVFSLSCGIVVAIVRMALWRVIYH